ncbi:MAG: chemotaxis protein CheA [Burkholderiaceae bacterium]|nr:chemotaxis protein CheA [Burkholderiaceae bacterium]
MSTYDDDAEIIAAARAGFLDEAADMLAQFEQALLVMETAPDDAENLNAAFRAAHTIKGTAGLFGCDAVVLFTHEVETLLEGLRSGQQQVSDAIVAALLQGRDQIEALIDEVRSGQADPAVAARSVSLGAEIRALYGGEAATAPADDAASARQCQGGTTQPAGATAPCWHLSLRFGPDALRNGLDPMAFLRYLRQIGSVTAVHTLTGAVPNLADIDAEACHLGFELRLCTAQDRATIEQVFEFAVDDCELTILEPGSDLSLFAALLDARCGDDDAARAALQAVWDGLGDWPTASAPAEAPDVQAQAATPASDSTTPPAAEAASADASTAVPERRLAPRDRRADEARYVKVRADKLDHLIDLIGELVIAGSGAQMVATAEGAVAMLEATQRVSELIQATRDGALALRMVPVGETFARFQRVVRDTAKQLGKDIELVVTGGDTELDKSMVERIGDPLMHLVRNSLDHGIETAAERAEAGKPGTGRLALHAYHEAGSIVIEVSDDGRGLDRDRILAKARERGLIDADTVLTEQEIWQLIFAPGFSTKEAVTDLSGRGVGMDVVKRNIESLRGHISLATTPGRGTTTQIRLPLTLAMIDGFLARVGGVHYVLPLAVVSECIDVPAECRATDGAVTGTFDLRGEVLPWLDLAPFYGSVAAEDGRRSLIVVRDGATRIGLIVDRLLGEHQTVIKPLSPMFRPLQALAGSTILGSGDVALVLDIQGLVMAATRSRPTVRPSSAAH